MKAIILYGSRYGSTRRYAEELSGQTGIPAVSYQQAPELSGMDTIIYLGGLSAGGVDRAIRTAIQVCCRRTHPQRPGEKLPTVRQFLAALADGSGGSL